MLFTKYLSMCRKKHVIVWLFQYFFKISGKLTGRLLDSTNAGEEMVGITALKGMLKKG